MNVINTLINEFIGVIFNILLFSIIPLMWYLIKEKSSKGFFNSIGIYKPQNINVFETVLIITIVYLVTLSTNIVVIKLGYSGRNTVDTQYFTSLTFFMYLLLYGLKTGIAEEILFRGFVAKKLIENLGFLKGNALQALVFALPHFVIRGSASLVDITVRIINAFLLGYTFGYIVDRKSDGSIIPVMIAHILINMASSLILTVIL
ncbi:CPBP family intramembrane glutamic endopeptidase [Clostridium tunisiense]|uniref:CPBP family intramembrane glutamic endopeptidase n=1 Tax=Clostridium tunisiense TaxID=219748 RepID=UPI0002FD4F49|nr:type II CAAX endopeptidase family protein [Clostridium tunisiense]